VYDLWRRLNNLGYDLWRRLNNLGYDLWRRWNNALRSACIIWHGRRAVVKWRERIRTRRPWCDYATWLIWC